MSEIMSIFEIIPFQTNTPSRVLEYASTRHTNNLAFHVRSHGRLLDYTVPDHHAKSCFTVHLYTKRMVQLVTD